MLRPPNFPEPVWNICLEYSGKRFLAVQDRTLRVLWQDLDARWHRSGSESCYESDDDEEQQLEERFTLPSFVQSVVRTSSSTVGNICTIYYHACEGFALHPDPNAFLFEGFSCQLVETPKPDPNLLHQIHAHLEHPSGTTYSLVSPLREPPTSLDLFAGAKHILSVQDSSEPPMYAVFALVAADDLIGVVDMCDGSVTVWDTKPQTVVRVFAHASVHHLSIVSADPNSNSNPNLFEHAYNESALFRPDLEHGLWLKTSTKHLWSECFTYDASSDQLIGWRADLVPHTTSLSMLAFEPA